MLDEERALDRPDTGQEKVSICPLVLGVGILHLLLVRKFKQVIKLYALDDIYLILERVRVKTISFVRTHEADHG